MKAVEVMGVRVELPTNQPIVLLREAQGERYVPIWVGAPEGSAIAQVLEGVVPERPMTHDLLLEVIHTLGGSLSRVDIVRMTEGIFFAELVLADGTRIDARSSDAVAVALRARCPIYIDDQILDEIGVTIDLEEDDEVERFREFLDHVDPEDFEDPSRTEGPGDET